MVRIKITEEQDNCVTVYWAELTGLLPEGGPRLMGCGRYNRRENNVRC